MSILTLLFSFAVLSRYPMTMRLHNQSDFEQYARGHIPGAGFADLKGNLSDTDSEIEFDLPSPEAFCESMGKLGVGDESSVVLYDNVMSAWAARVWWMLRWVGFDRAAILDGGFQARVSEGREISTGPVRRRHSHLTPAPRSSMIADVLDVRSAIDDGDVTLIDTLPAVNYRGEETIYARPGHIPTAINICGIDYLDESGHLKPEHELGMMQHIDNDARVITYCGGGILASLNAFVMTRQGYRDVMVYTASLQEWADDPANPMVTGDDQAGRG